MNNASPSLMTRTRSLRRGLGALALIAFVYELFARSGLFAQALMPSLVWVADTLWSMLADGTMLQHTLYTLGRVLAGLGLAIAIGLPLGLLMGRVPAIERFFMPLVSVLMPIPSLAWVPIFILWFGIGNVTTILIVFYASTFPMLLNAWSGIRSINPLWLRAASAMGANGDLLFRKVIVPASLPFLITGFRQSFQRAWIAVIGAEMIAASAWGLGWVIFDAKEFLNADVMLASLVMIGLVGFLFERYVLRTLEQVTVQRWGMVRAARG